MKHFFSFFKLGLFIVGFIFLYSVKNVNAQTCCLIQEFSRTTIEPSLQYPSGAVEDGPTTNVGCRLFDPVVGCNTQPSSIGGSRNEIRGDRRSFVTPYQVEQGPIQCTVYANQLAGCAQALIDTLVDCNNFNNDQAACDARNECFHHAGVCKSVFDVSTCQTLPNNFCTQSRVCEWNGQQCVSQLEANLSREYQVAEGHSRFIPACAYAGTCRDLEDLIGVVIAITREVLRYIGILAFVFFLIGGATMIASFGNQERFKKGRQILVAASVGLVISLSAFVLVSFILTAVGVTDGFRIF